MQTAAAEWTQWLCAMVTAHTKSTLSLCICFRLLMSVSAFCHVRNKVIAETPINLKGQLAFFQLELLRIITSEVLVEASIQ